MHAPIHRSALLTVPVPLLLLRRTRAPQQTPPLLLLLFLGVVVGLRREAAP
jgi:hypothetical protein